MKKFLKIAAIVLGVCFCAVVGLFVWRVIILPSDPTNLSRSISISISPSSKARSTSEPEEDKEQETKGLRWYDTVEEAMEDDELIKGGDKFAMQIYEDIYKREGTVEIARAECGDSLIIFYMPKYSKEEKEQQEKKKAAEYFDFIQFRIMDGKISQPYYTGHDTSSQRYYSGNWEYDCDDMVVSYMKSKLMTDLFIKEEDRVSIFFGMWPDKEEIESLTISGIKP